MVIFSRFYDRSRDKKSKSDIIFPYCTVKYLLGFNKKRYQSIRRKLKVVLLGNFFPKIAKVRPIPNVEPFFCETNQT